MSATETAIFKAFEAAAYTQIHIELDDGDVYTVDCADFAGNVFSFDFEIGSDDDCLFFTEIEEKAAPVIVEIPEEGFED